MRGMVGLVILIGVALGGVAAADPAAEEHYNTGRKLYAAKKYTDAAARFRAAHALDAQPRYLFNLAQAERQAGNCDKAVIAYRDFLASNPPEDQARVARSGLEKCNVTEPAPPTEPHTTVTPPPTETETKQTEEDAASKLEKEESIPPPPAPPITKEIRERDPWYRDILGDVLLGAGIVAGAISVSSYIGARSSADATFEPGPLEDYEHHRQRVDEQHTFSLVTGGASAVLITLAVIRYARRPTHVRHVVVAPAHGGGSVLLGGTF